MTPAQFFALLDRAKLQYERSLYGPALVCSTIANVNRDPKKQRKPFQPADFMPFIKNEKKLQSVEQQLQTVAALNAALGGIDDRR